MVFTDSLPDPTSTLKKARNALNESETGGSMNLPLRFLFHNRLAGSWNDCAKINVDSSFVNKSGKAGVWV